MSMKKLSWAVMGLLAAACAANMFAGCGSDNGVTIGGDDGGDEGNVDGSNANGDANGNGNGDANGGNSDANTGGNKEGGVVPEGGNYFEGGVIPDASRAETGTCDPTIGDSCTKSSDCCSANCDTTGHCAIPNSFCRAPGAVCLSGLDCCTGSCVGNVCSNVTCVQNTLACAANTDCCSGNCSPNPTGGGGTCEPVVQPGGGGTTCQTVNLTCKQNSDCCSGDCQAGVCVAPSYCGQNGDVCATSADCCGGICTITGTGILGICGQPPKPSGTNNCTIDGQLCGGLYTGGSVGCNNSCCSHSCSPYAPTGYLICQPASGCHPEGEICLTDAECCGGPGSAYYSTTMIQCAGAVPAMGIPGRCSIGQTCRAPGAVCDPHIGATCNTSSKCCGLKGSNVNPLDTPTHPNICGYDNLGIPRCKDNQDLDCTATDAGSLVGAACATSADCCGLPCTPDKNGVYHCGATTCVAAGGTCTSIADCCAGLPCTMDPGAATGICGGITLPDGGVVTPPDGGTSSGDAGGPGGGNDAGTGGSDGGGGGTCAAYGQLCNVTADCCKINGNVIPCTNGRCLTP
jgi:hypothetical protein